MICMESSCDSSSVIVPGPVLAGVEYVCNVSVYNRNGKDSMLLIQLHHPRVSYKYCCTCAIAH